MIHANLYGSIFIDLGLWAIGIGIFICFAPVILTLIVCPRGVVG